MASQKLYYDTTSIKEAIKRKGYTLWQACWKITFELNDYRKNITHVVNTIYGYIKMPEDEMIKWSELLDLDIDIIKKIFEKKTKVPNQKAPNRIQYVTGGFSVADLDSIFNKEISHHYALDSSGRFDHEHGKIYIHDLIWQASYYPDHPLIKMYICKLYNLRWDVYHQTKERCGFDDVKMLSYLYKHRGELPKYSK